MRKLLSIGALAATSLLTIGQPAIADQQASITPVRMVVHHGPFIHNGRRFSRRVWVRGRWHRGRFIAGHWMYIR